MEEDPFEHGRVGYGAYAKYTPALLALGIVLVIGYIGWMQQKPARDAPRAGTLVGRPAPAWSLTLLDGQTVSNADFADQVVVLNFWASWCAPCEAEMPELDRLNTALAADGRPATIIGVGIKQDNQDNALALVDRLGVTYPIGRDTAGADTLVGPVTQAFGVDTFPATVFIDPDGIVSAIVFGPLDEAEASARIDAALEG